MHGPKYKKMDYVIFRVYFGAQAQGKIVTCDSQYQEYYLHEQAVVLISFTCVVIPNLWGLCRSEFLG
jgi:hypothetical protein